MKERKTRLFRFAVTPSAALLLGAAVYFCGAEKTAALLVPAAVHEAGHLLAMLASGRRVRGMTLRPGGACIEYASAGNSLCDILIASAGPLAGMAYAFLCRAAGAHGGEWLILSAELSVLLSAFNLLPILPLDGGQIVRTALCSLLGTAAGGRAAAHISRAAAAAFLLLGIVTWALFSRPGLLFPGLCLAWAQRNERRG